MIRYRIKVRDSKDFPYIAEYKVGFLGEWKKIDIYESVDYAEAGIVSFQRTYKHIPKAGTVVKKYKGQDITALILRIGTGN